MRGRSSGKTGPPVPGHTRVGGGAITLTTPGYGGGGIGGGIGGGEGGQAERVSVAQ